MATGSCTNQYRAVLVVWAVCLILLSWSIVGDVGAPDPKLSKKVAHGGGNKLKPSPPKVTVTGHQRCEEDNTCTCDKGYTGEHCEEAVCDQGCIHGKCLRPGYCTCEEGYKGRACDEPVCSKPCNHGKCTQPDFCKCSEGWFGLYCDQQCKNGSFKFAEQECACKEGWTGKECNAALCSTYGCDNGECVSPDNCQCFSGWAAANCTIDQVTDNSEELLNGLSIRIRRPPGIVVHRGEQYYRDSWRNVRKWTAHLQSQWTFGRTRFTEGLPANDTLLKYVDNKFETCAAVGNSGGLLRSRAGEVIDEHDIVLRFNNAPTKTFEEFTGTKTTFRLLNRKSADNLLEASAPPKDTSKKKQHHQGPITLLWRAESYHYYGMLRKKYPDETIYLVAPEILIPLITVYKTVMKRMEDMNVTWEGSQSAPTGFVGIAFLLQICKQVDVFGFDTPKPSLSIRYHYYDKTEPSEQHSTEFEHNLLRVLHANKLIRMCTVDTVETCIHDWEMSQDKMDRRRRLQSKSPRDRLLELGDNAGWSNSELEGRDKEERR